MENPNPVCLQTASLINLLSAVCVFRRACTFHFKEVRDVFYVLAVFPWLGRCNHNNTVASLILIFKAIC